MRKLSAEVLVICPIMLVQNLLFFILEHLLSVWDNCEHFLQMQMFEHPSKNLFSN